ncbi:hypothetical protein CBR_g39302 [Chara braunii]|uniref:Aspartic peptidase DDI1-type domain-containing protein n=1 Tax=Chara braunii TaxID=69332 RepID=A0A388K143_CHABU|nr:hypothetical protein CBR_g39302 [Chara braunii]|eukprot:GBG63758.1 hypothetical protein CBR_g39302 [Chara braunii]
MDGNINDQFGEATDRRFGGVRAEAQRRAAAGPPPPAMFRLWQEKEEPPIGVEEVESDEEVTQGPRGGSKGEEPIIIESDDENEEESMEPSSVLFGKMKDLLHKMGKYQQKLVGLCEEVRKWKSNIPKVFLYDSGSESAPGRPRVNVVGLCPQSGMMGRPLTPQARLAQVARKRSQAKASASQKPPRRELEPGKRKEVVEVEDDDNEEEEDERLRREEDQRAEQRARKKGARGEVEPVMRDGPPKRKKYAVQLEEGFDVEKVIDRLLEGHNDLMTLKEILASAPRLRDELNERLSRRLVPNVHLGTILPKEAEWAESGAKMDWKCVACGTMNLVVKGSMCAAMVDTGAEMNISREADAIRFGLDIDRSDCGILHGASCKAVFCGTTSNVLIEVGKVKARACFFIMLDVDHGILLGRSFLSRTETVIFNKQDGMLILLLCDPSCGNYEIMTCRNTGPRNIRNRPNLGSFTIQESESERRRFRQSHDRSQRQRDPEPKEARPSRGGRKALAKREEEPEPEQEAEEREAYPECGLGPVEFHQFTEGGLRRSPTRTQEEPPASEGPLRELETHLDISRWRASPQGEEHGEQAEEMPQEGVPREEVQAAIIESLRQQTQGKVDKPESSRQGEQRQPGHGLPGLPSAAEPRQEPPMGRVILEPEEARVRKQEEREAFEFRAPTELATLPVATAGPVVPLAVEEGLPPSSSEPAQGSAEGSMGVLLRAVHTMQEEASLFSPEQRIEDPLEREMGIEAEGVIEGGLQRLGTPEYEPEEIEQQPVVVPGEMLESRPQRLDVPECVPATGDLRSRLGSWATRSGSGGSVPGIEQQEVVSTTTPRSEQQGFVSTLLRFSVIPS